MGRKKTFVLIASANSIFRIGILKILSTRNNFQNLIIEQASELKDVLKKYSKNKPRVLVIDYDDKNIKKKIFLNSFLQDQHNAQLLLVSLEQSGNVIFYDRQVLSTDEAYLWLQTPWNENQSFINSE
jgi:DNA-binding NarL/FixJ family response regulator